MRWSEKSTDSWYSYCCAISAVVKKVVPYTRKTKQSVISTDFAELLRQYIQQSYQRTNVGLSEKLQRVAPPLI